MTDLQEDVTVGANGEICGTLHYVEEYTGFSGDASEQEGNYLALHFEADDATSISVRPMGGTGDPKALDEDGLLVMRVRQNVEGIEVYTVVGGVTYMNLVRFVGLVKEPKEET